MNQGALQVLLGLGLSWPEMLEMGMIVCFGVSWPVSIARMLRLRRSEGKSLGFIALILLGYLLGMAAKIVCARADDAELPAVTWLYALNSAFVGVDGLLCIYFRRCRGAQPHGLALLRQPQRLRDAASAARAGAASVRLAPPEITT